MRTSALWAIGLVFSVLLAPLSAAAAEAALPIASKTVTFTDTARPVKASSGFAGAPVRRLDVMVWYPAVKASDGRKWPLIVYSHGTNGAPDNNMHLVNALVGRGYVVAAPAYPLSSLKTYTRIRMTDISDVVEQTRDIAFVIDRLLADPTFAGLIDPSRIGTTGHSLGGVTSYFTSFGVQTRDPRIGAVALTGAGDPVQTALSGNMGLWGTQHAALPVPVLFLSAEKDVFARTTGRPHAAYARLEKPKYEILVRGGVHVWFRDGTDQPPGNKNPDCLFFERNMPTITMPGCEEAARRPLIGPARQQEITRTAIVDFFDAYLKRDPAALDRLRNFGKSNADVEFLSDD